MSSPIGYYRSSGFDTLTISQSSGQSCSGNFMRNGDGAAQAFNFTNGSLNGVSFKFTGTVPANPTYGIAGGEVVMGDLTFSSDFSNVQGTLLDKGIMRNVSFQKMADSLDSLGNPITGEVKGAYSGIVRGLPVTLTVGAVVQPQQGTGTAPVQGPSNVGTLQEAGVTYQIQGPISRDYISFTVYNYRDGKSHWSGLPVDWSCKSLSLSLDGDGGAVEGPYILTQP
ncbi:MULTISPECIES: hypothetical protein [Pseudomonas]|uniref:Uncharacterized protein n=1 Tax=Pseudomonas azadiae TaxID=2843612 RepID=A0ABS6NZX7_9PSED|nr:MULTISPECIES: hypothetical protein [Pseudomonas]MBV4453758.1 hypothetical protein [Pseudomonas azadiae]NMF44145.1 hypothetical protein [Pseudomonas sp. SWRI 103]